MDCIDGMQPRYMQYIRAGADDRITAYLDVCGIGMPMASDGRLRILVQDLFDFYGSDSDGEHVTPVQPFMLDGEDPDYLDFVTGGVEEREQILERRIILRFNELMHTL